MDLKRIRNDSIETAKELDVDVLPTLPLLDAGLQMRNSNEAVSRILAMNALAATAYGFDKAKAVSWLNREELADSLSDPEKRFIYEGVGQPDQFKVLIEGMWALAWALGIAKDLDFAKDCDNGFAAKLPNLKQSQSSADFRKTIHPRLLEELVAACDLAYCLHWAIRQAELIGGRTPGNLKPYVVVERRRALEWLLSKGAWDEVSLDT